MKNKQKLFVVYCICALIISANALSAKTEKYNYFRYTGLNTYYVMPDFILTPYLGAGSGLLLYSVQSE